MSCGIARRNVRHRVPSTSFTSCSTAFLPRSPNLALAQPVDSIPCIRPRSRGADKTGRQEPTANERMNHDKERDESAGRPRLRRRDGGRNRYADVGAGSLSRWAGLRSRRRPPLPPLLPRAVPLLLAAPVLGSLLTARPHVKVK